MSGNPSVFEPNLHLTIRSSNNNDGTVHRSGTGNHVFNVISVSRTVDVRVMTVIGFIFDMGSRDSDTTGPFFWGLIDRSVVMKTSLSFCSENLGDSSSQSGLLYRFVSTCGSCFGGETNCGANLSVIDMSNSSWIKLNYSNSPQNRVDEELYTHQY